MKFKFKFDKIMHHREIEKNLAKGVFFRSKKDFDDAKAEMIEMQDKIHQARRFAHLVRQSMPNDHGWSILQWADHFIDGQKAWIEKYKKKLQRLQMVMEEKQEALVTATIEHKKLEKLAERQQQEFRKEMKKKEIKFFDEINIAKGSRRILRDAK